MSHLKRYTMPKSWPLPVKAETFVIRPSPGPHKLGVCMPLQVVLRDVLGIAETKSEARSILNQGKVLVDKKVRRKPKFPVGLMDIVEIPDMKKAFRMNVSRKGIFLEEIPIKDASSKLCMVTGKKTLAKGAEQINLHDGRNIKLDKPASYRVHDTVVLSLPDQKIINHVKLEKGSPAFIYSGKNMGIVGKIKEVKKRSTMTEKSTVLVESKEKETETLLEYVFVGEALNGKAVSA